MDLRRMEERLDWLDNRPALCAKCGAELAEWAECCREHPTAPVLYPLEMVLREFANEVNR